MHNFMILRIFASSTQPIPLPEDRLKNLQEAGKVLNEKFGGSFCNCVKEANQSAQQLLKLIVDNFPCFRDEAVIGGKTVSLYKRAQVINLQATEISIVYVFCFCNNHISLSRYWLQIFGDCSKEKYIFKCLFIN